MSKDLWEKTEQKRLEGKAHAKSNELWVRNNINHIQQSIYLRNMIKALEIMSWQNTIEDWQRYYEAKYALTLRRRKR